MSMHACPHCAREISRGVLRKHIDACPLNPVVRQATAALLEDSARPGYAVSFSDYQRAQRGTRAATTLMLMGHYGSWPAVAQAHGLQVDESIHLEECPHCRRMLHASRMYLHEPRCPERADVWQATHAILLDPDNPERARSQNDYRRAAPGTGASSPGALIDHYRSWPAVVAAHGLVSLVRRHVGDRAKVASLNAPLSDEERHACARRGLMER